MEKIAATTNKLFAEVSIHSDSGKFLTPKRIRLLEAIDEHGSIIQAAKALPMSYKNAWDCIQDMNKAAGHKLVDSDKQEGSYLTSMGKFVVDMYHGIQKACTYGVSYMNDAVR